jgi:nitrogen fixation/metabolism regulation signal transduction histidine kinase
MGYNRFYLIILFRVLLMVITCLTLGFIVFLKQYWFSVFGLVVLLIIQVFSLVAFLNKSNDFVARFVNYLREENTNFQIPEKYNKPPYENLIRSLHETGLFVKKAMLMKEYQHHYLQYIINNVGVGLIVFLRDGKIDLMNPIARQLLNIRTISHIYELKSVDESLEHLLLTITPGEDRVHKVLINSQLSFLSFKATEFKISDKSYKLVAFSNIREELDQKELESWQTLIRVLSHELMNTITPVNSLTRSLMKMYHNTSVQENSVITQDTRTGLELISERVTELVKLVDRYKLLSRIPVPDFKDVDISEVTEKICRLLSTEAIEKQISINFRNISGKGKSVPADAQMISQVLNNVLRNAMEEASHANKKIIDVYVVRNGNRMEVNITDYGKGILPDEMEKIFIPFYTTRENGSGIGLSLSRQIMRLHKGSIKAVSVPDSYTTFTISL